VLYRTGITRRRLLFVPAAPEAGGGGERLLHNVHLVLRPLLLLVVIVQHVLLALRAAIATPGHSGLRQVAFTLARGEACPGLARAMPLHATVSQREERETAKRAFCDGSTNDSQALCDRESAGRAHSQGRRGGGATVRTACVPSKENASPACWPRSRLAAAPALLRDTADTRPHPNAHLSPSTCVSQRRQLTLTQVGLVDSSVRLLPEQGAVATLHWPSHSARVSSTTTHG
jgi:hypothetical protein